MEALFCANSERTAADGNRTSRYARAFADVVFSRSWTRTRPCQEVRSLQQLVQENIEPAVVWEESCRFRLNRKRKCWIVGRAKLGAAKAVRNYWPC